MFLKRVSKRPSFRNPFECYTDCVNFETPYILDYNEIPNRF
jgi:hypothetical protein